MIWLYAVCDRPELPPPRRRGMAQSPLDAVRAGELLAVISRHVHPPGEPALDALWVHERVVERLMADRAVLPMRFGSRLPDEGAVRDLLEARQQAFLAALDRVRGRVELGVRAIRRGNGAAPGDPVAPAPETASGRDYVLSKVRESHRTEHAAATLHDPLAALADAARRQRPRSPDEVLRASYLVDRGSLPRFRAAVERLQRTQPDAAILCTGPWPPYSFVDAVEPRVEESA